MGGNTKHNIKFGKYRKLWDAMKAERCGRKYIFMFSFHQVLVGISFKVFLSIMALRLQAFFFKLILNISQNHRLQNP